ncbi:hypothetical protein [Pontibacter fetidus]|uniref:GAF domain-containing protein n=1 Tax=Pontibacter fetidus TaxID=2700082 RepID=A0A6B2GXP5_9BACT|nr:hypothetical protein [Pontibacter fetidus]NDK55615.1 hypothetical protein [Pontibacter fetidus]
MKVNNCTLTANYNFSAELIFLIHSFVILATVQKMEYRFIHHWQYEPGEEENRILDEAIALIAAKRSDSFLTSLAAFISEKTKAKYILIGLLTEDAQKAHSCTFLCENRELTNISYSLKGTPCDDVVTQRFCYFPVNVANSFPTDIELMELGIQSYLGSLLLSDAGEPIGLISLMDEKPLENAAFAEHLILVLSPAIEEELIRLRANATLQTIA